MKQVQSDISLDRWVSWGKVRLANAPREYRRVDGYPGLNKPPVIQARPWSWTGVVITLLTTTWFTISLPFRLVFWLIALLGRLTGVILGFLLMVVGMALWASPLFVVGIPIFVIGLVLTLRCLE